MAKALLAAHFPEDQRVRASMVVPAAAPLAPPPQAPRSPACDQVDARHGIHVTRDWVARNC
jgi:hypothetical protein